MEEDTATFPKDVLDTHLSSIPNLKGFTNMLGLSSSQQYFFDMNLSPIRTSPPPLSPPHPITTSPVSQPPHVNSSSTSMTLPHKEFFSTSDYFTSLTFTSSSSPINIPPLGIQIPLKQT